ncbi:fatty acyl-AMP ligase [Streptomyces cellulosae]|uniref:fatty acyl-AMP ligase n=1 Tax=Streptomyces cellulosae TaxID=1968 RepID=UPI00068CF3BB|nr:fatty acyl-AMP ligase [Streptomyces cellulosae]
MSSAMGDTLSRHLAQSAQQAPDEAAFTFMGFGANRDGTSVELTWKELDTQVRTVAAGLRRAGAVGERVAIVAPQGLDYVIGFLGSVSAGAIAVPLFPPDLPGHSEKLAAVLADAAPSFAISAPEQREAVADFCAGHGIDSGVRVVSVEGLTQTAGTAGTQDRTAREPQPEDCAYLQYTSGSTRTPSGVEITHANVCVNARQALAAYDVGAGRHCSVSWLPMYHDMGLMLAIAMPVVGRMRSVIMDPLDFVQQPVRWLRLLTHYERALTAAPNFAYDYCVHRVPPEERTGLSLGSVAGMINGSEPVSPRTLERFYEAFAPSGVRRTTMRPSYGLAEATVFVTTSPAGEEPTVTPFDRDLLAQGTAHVAEPAEGGSITELVACGRPADQEVAIVDPVTRRRQQDGKVGEIWLQGPNIGRGYWGRPLDGESFGAVLEGGDPADPAQRWLRTGDLGIWHDKQLYVTGRIKDLVIVDGTNHYPHDIELTVENAHSAIRRHHTAAFAVSTDEGERLVVVAEHSPAVTDPGTHLDEVTRAVRRAVSVTHGVAVHDFVYVPPGSVPRTTSGKVARSACRAQYLAEARTATKHAALKGAGTA